ncbi:MAG: serine hydrolase [Pseudomonadota bacterium]
MLKPNHGARRAGAAIATSVALALGALSAAHAAEPRDETEIPTAMRSVPAAKDDQVTLMNWARPPFNAWGFRNTSVNPALMVARGGPVHPMPEAPADPAAIEGFRFEHNGETGPLLDAIRAERVDGVLILKDGAVIYERYFGAFKPHHHHLWASVTKSMIGMLVGILVEEGALDLGKTVAEYLPEMAESGFADRTLRQLLNMTTALEFSEDYANLAPGSVHLEYFRRLGLTPAFDLMALDPQESETPRGVLELLPRFTADPDTPPGTVFTYQSPNVDVIGWIIARVEGAPLHEVVRERIWARIGAEHDAFFLTDVAFTPIATGGFNTTLRDFARFGLAVAQNGRLGDTQIFPEAWARAVPSASAADRAAARASVYADPESEAHDPAIAAYRGLWWIQDPERAVFGARGIFGQTLYINRAKGVVAVRFSARETASNAAAPSFRRLQAGLHLLAESL